MKKELLKSTLLIVCLLSSISASAYDFESGGIYYDITLSEDKTVAVTYANFFYNSYGGSIVIPASVTNEGTTYYVTSIDQCAFRNCTDLTKITISNSVTKIGEFAFWSCSSLTSITIPNSVKKIGSWVFYNCSGLTSITIPNSVTEIGMYAFAGCSGLKKFIVDSRNNNYSALDGALFNKDKTMIVSYPNEKSQKYTIPNSVTEIGGYAFHKCKGLTSVSIPNSVTEIGEAAFSFCPSLTSVEIPNSVTEISDLAFYDCSGLESVTISNSITEIGKYAFWGCSGLTSITIPNSVTEIEDCAFDHCTSLKEIYNYSERPQSISENVFEKVDTQTCVLYVPKGTVEAYKASDYWKDFVNIKEF